MLNSVELLLFELENVEKPLNPFCACHCFDELFCYFSSTLQFILCMIAAELIGIILGVQAVQIKNRIFSRLTCKSLTVTIVCEIQNTKVTIFFHRFEFDSLYVSIRDIEKLCLKEKKSFK